MPMYDFRCTNVNCDNVFEGSYRIDDRNIPCEAPCEKCGGVIERYLPSSPSWHEVDWRTKLDCDGRYTLKNMKNFYEKRGIKTTIKDY